MTKEEILQKIKNFPSLSSLIGETGALQELYNAVAEYANQDKWISCKNELPDKKKVGSKVLLFRKMNDSQIEMAITVYDTFLVKHCDPETTFYQPLPNPPKQ
jgi:hypothetical protein